jgi:hypothetical protein
MAADQYDSDGRGRCPPFVAGGGSEPGEEKRLEKQDSLAQGNCADRPWRGDRDGGGSDGVKTNPKNESDHEAAKGRRFTKGEARKEKNSYHGDTEARRGGGRRGMRWDGFNGFNTLDGLDGLDGLGRINRIDRIDRI